MNRDAVERRVKLDFMQHPDNNDKKKKEKPVSEEYISVSPFRQLLETTRLSAPSVPGKEVDFGW